MKIIVNGCEESSPEGKTVADILNHFISREQGSLAQRIHVDGEELPLNAPATLSRAITDIGTLEIDYIRLDEMVNKNRVNAEEYLEKLIPGIEKAAELFRLGNEQEANQYFLNIIDGMSWFSQVVVVISEAVGIDSREEIFGGNSIETRLKTLTDFSKQLLEANKNNDWVLVADLLEYEIQPYYSEWVDILPRLVETKG